jgi:DNA invertase Pin-like site-specific DNA recombinase
LIYLAFSPYRADNGPCPKPEETAINTALAYSYIRFSTPEQAKGDSLRRQTELLDRWLAETGVKLDTTLTLRDEGVSGYTGEHRENPDRHGLACFLEAIRSNRVKRGSYLIVENLDRLSREDVVPAVNLFTGILIAGVRIVQLTPHTQVYDAKADMMDLMRAIMELSRGNGESKRKSGMLSKVWEEKRRRALKDREPVSNRLPGWIVNHNGKLGLHKQHSKTVRRIFQLSLDGYGVERLAKTLNAEGVPTFTGRCKTWAISTLYAILTSRAVFGEFQPHTASGTNGQRIAAGDPVSNYFPPVISEDLYWQVQEARQKRLQGGGRTGKHVNICQGLLCDARDGGPFVMMNAKQRPSILFTLNAKQGLEGAVWSAFPLVPFERAVVSCLAEIKPEDVLPPTVESKALALAGELAAVEKRLLRLKALLRETDEAEELVQTVRDLSADRTRLVDALEAEKGREAAPLAEAWGAVKPLAEAMEEQGWSDDARVRLKAAVGRVVESIWLLVLPAVKGQDRLAAAQLRFKDSDSNQRRDYLIRVRPPKSNGKATVPGFWCVRSWTDEELRKAMMPVQFDLRHADATCLGEDDEGHTAWAPGWRDVETHLLALSAEDIDQLVFAGCAKHELP